MVYNEKVQNKTHFNTVASPSWMCTKACICHSLLHLVDADPTNRQKFMKSPSLQSRGSMSPHTRQKLWSPQVAPRLTSLPAPRNTCRSLLVKMMSQANQATGPQGHPHLGSPTPQSPASPSKEQKDKHDQEKHSPQAKEQKDKCDCEDCNVSNKPKESSSSEKDHKQSADKDSSGSASHVSHKHHPSPHSSSLKHSSKKACIDSSTHSMSETS